MADRWVKGISHSGCVRGVAIEATQLVQKLAAIHSLSAASAQGMGEITMAALLLASYCKAGERMNLNVRGTGQFIQGLADAYPDGTVRGFVVPREPSEAFFGENNELGPWGSGTLSVLRARDRGVSQPFIGTVPLVTGHLAKDLTFYWYQSEQVPSAVGLAVKTDGTHVVSAGAFMVQALPQASEEELKTIETHIAEIDSLANQLSPDANPMMLLAQIFQGGVFSLLEEKPVSFSCSCSLERAERALLLSGSGEATDTGEVKDTIIHCDFCRKDYSISVERIRELRAKRATADDPTDPNKG